MAQVPEKVLSWLYSVLGDYRDAQRTYSDTARTLSAYPSLNPRTEVYTYENGGSALLLTVSGTLPVTFRSANYRFPVKIWVPQAYPQEAPMAYVTPGKDMIVRPGQHVGVDGKIYHPYLRDWAGMWDRASIAELLEFLQQVFAKEPPVISKAQQQQFQRQIGQPQVQQQELGASPVPPQRPPKQSVGNAGPPEMPSSDVPPPRPPKPGEESASSWPQRVSSRDVARDGPPLPPLPHERSRSQQHTALPQFQTAELAASHRQSRALSQPFPGQQNGRPLGPSLPPTTDQRRAQSYQYQQQIPGYDKSPVSPISPMNGYSGQPENRYSRPPALPPIMQQQAPYQEQPHQPTSQTPQQQKQYHQSYQPKHQQQQYPPNQFHPQTLPPQPAQKQPPPDLLSDPFDIALSGSSTSGPPLPAPPIPPNPEKEHLLHALSTTLTAQLHQKIHQNLSALAPLQAQSQALQQAHSNLQAEIRQLEQLDQTLASNEAILHRSIQDCDAIIQNTKSKPPPPIDEVLIAPTMVANQLWTLCAEEAACKEAMYVLQKAVDRGRVSGNDFVRQMRALGRERFLKMVVARKCARGLGLDV